MATRWQESEVWRGINDPTTETSAEINEGPTASNVMQGITPDSIPPGKPEPKKKPKKRTLGTLYQLSNSCRATARLVALTRLLVIVYDNINMMIRIAEQVLGRTSEHAWCINDPFDSTNLGPQMHRKTEHVLL